MRLSSICQDVIEESKADDGSEHTTNLTNHSAVSNNSCPSDEVLRKISTNDDTINDAVSEPVSDDVCVPETPSESKVCYDFMYTKTIWISCLSSGCRSCK